MKAHPLREYRDQSGLTLEEMGKRIGVTKASVSRIEAGIQHPSPDLARTIETVTGIPKWQLRPDLWDRPSGSRGKAVA